MSTINELLDELRTIKENIRAAINTAWGEDVVPEDACLDSYSEYINGLCPCETQTHCVVFLYGDGFINKIERCGIEDGGCLLYTDFPSKPDYPEYDDFHYRFIGWSTDDTEDNIVTSDICNITEDIVLYGIYKLETYYVFYDVDGTTVLKEGYLLPGEIINPSDVPTPNVPSGYVLTGWNYTTPTSGGTASFPFTITSDPTIFIPQITPSTTISYKVSVDYDDTQSNISIN